MKQKMRREKTDTFWFPGLDLRLSHLPVFINQSSKETDRIHRVHDLYSEQRMEPGSDRDSHSYKKAEMSPNLSYHVTLTEREKSRHLHTDSSRHIADEAHGIFQIALTSD